MAKAVKTSPRKQISVDLALQGGGSHGAFTWGVLDRLLEEERLTIEAISGTSAGAMNAAVLADGYLDGGRDGARAALEKFWRKVSHAARFSPLRRTPLDVLFGRWTLDHSPAYLMMDMVARVVSPYLLNPEGGNPLSDILDECIDFERLAKSSIRVFITATNVHTGRGRVFRNTELTADVLLASACLPTLYHAVEIDGESYWDGGFSGNPTLTPLIEDSAAEDTILVQINPVERRTVPKTARDIQSRLNEISFNAVLLKELRMAAMLRKVADPGSEEGARWASMRLHRIASDVMLDLGHSSKLNAEWNFLAKLRDDGRAAASAFLDAHSEDLGHRSSLDLDSLTDLD
ncbi:patatin-like phospholipase family protein [Sinorhizobium sp. BG8]|uniref:patatin-like phospholipase family protein n=1 Tax=Sinorhizobium sp. BG8 TaxID=2613773 RepID=UPI00193D579B|nr:patatin-like phospholipase family protein [Sinorhizobium sp. BG8]QRM55786.1 patatin-like phospholipase family protein [Sinorhizobium sp. BG8]